LVAYFATNRSPAAEPVNERVPPNVVVPAKTPPTTVAPERGSTAMARPTSETALVIANCQPFPVIGTVVVVLVEDVDVDVDVVVVVVVEPDVMATTAENGENVLEMNARTR
jgi:hypothetical protein